MKLQELGATKFEVSILSKIKSTMVSTWRQIPDKIATVREITNQIKNEIQCGGF